MERGRDAAAVEQEDRLAAALGDRAELLEQRRRERIAALAAQVDDLDGRQPARDPAAELERSSDAQLSGRGVALP